MNQKMKLNAVIHQKERRTAETKTTQRSLHGQIGGICSRAATSAELTDVVDDQTLQEPHLDTMAEITDISSGSDHEKMRMTTKLVLQVSKFLPL